MLNPLIVISKRLKLRQLEYIDWEEGGGVPTYTCGTHYTAPPYNYYSLPLDKQIASIW